MTLILLFCTFFAGAKPVHPFLYRVTVDGRESYLLGTVHSHSLKVSDFDESLRRALTEVDAVYYENDDPATSEREMKLIRESRTTGALLSRTLPAVAIARVRALLRSVGTSQVFPGLDELPPGAAYVMVSTIAQLNELAHGTLPYPFAILTQLVSREARRRMVPLNSVDDNFTLLNAVIGLEAYGEFLLTYLNDRGRFVTPAWERAKMERDTEAYLRGDPPGSPALDAFTPLTKANQAFHEAQSLNHLRWFPILSAALRHESILVNVGVDKLVGPGGLVERFSALPGVTVTRLWTCGVTLNP